MLRRKDVQKMLNDICNSECYYNKKMNKSMDYQLFTDIEEILFLFYDALFKYKIIIGDMSYFQEYLEQIDKLIRKIDNFYDISNGLNRIIGRICAFKLGVKDVEDCESKEEVIRYIYDKYMVNGYYIHGFASHYYGNILEEGFFVEEYKNVYDKFLKVQGILNKKNHSKILEKDFNEKKVELEKMKEEKSLTNFESLEKEIQTRFYSISSRAYGNPNENQNNNFDFSQFTNQNI
jgi:hypothetical protein